MTGMTPGPAPVPRAEAARAGPDASSSEYWDEVARRLPRMRPMPPLLARRKRAAHLALIDRWVAPVHGLRILKTDLFEEAFAQGSFLPDLAGAGAEVWAIDVSAEIAGASVAAFPGDRPLRAVCGDVRRLPFADASFDVVVSNSTLDHFDSTTDIESSLSELARVLRPGGVAIVTVDNPRNLGHPLLRFAARTGMVPYRLGATFDRRGLAEAVGRTGLRVDDTTTLLHNPRLVAAALAAAAGAVRCRWPADAVDRLLDRWERVESPRWRERLGSFVAVRGVKDSGAR